MKKFKYTWELNGTRRNGLKIVDDEESLTKHIKGIGGHLIKVISSTDVPVTVDPLLKVVIPDGSAALKDVDGFMVRQQVKMFEVLSGMEDSNSYEILDRNQRYLFEAEETSETMVGMLLLRALRAFTIEIWDGSFVLMTLKRPFHFYFHELNIYGVDDVLIGRVLRKFNFFTRTYTVVDPSTGKVLLVLHGPIHHPWTFYIYKGDQKIGHIKKRWSGFLKENYTNVDNFTTEFPAQLSLQEKKLLLGAIILIDFVHFENVTHCRFFSFRAS